MSEFEKMLRAWKHTVSESGAVREAKSRRYFKSKRERAISKRIARRRLGVKARR